MESYLPITYLNDFIFCPRSIYFHQRFAPYSQSLYHNKEQTVGKIRHEAIEDRRYSTSKNVLQNLDVYSEKYRLCGKVDIYNQQTKELVERKYQIKQIYDGYRYQIYAHYFCLQEMGYAVSSLFLHSLKDNKRYPVPVPQEGDIKEFERLLNRIDRYHVEEPFQQNIKKCNQCVYRTLCDIN